MNKLKLALCLLIFFPIYAYAYLDPGTGSALMAAMFGIFGSLLFFSKSIFFKIKAKLTGNAIVQVQSKLAFFSEGSKYWIYYEDILKELIKMKQFFTYYTMDIDDPVFQLLDFGNINADLDAFCVQYVGKGNKGYAAISNLKEKVLVTTTPNIGIPGYPVKRPENCKNLIYISHSVNSIGGFRKNALDLFNTVISSGAKFEKDIRMLEKKRNLPAKEFLIGGLPYMDNLIKRAEDLNIRTDGKTVLIASTWDKRGILRTYGSDFIEKIANAGYNVIVRPHPYSYVYEPDFINKLQKDLSMYGNIVFDEEVDNLLSMAKADVMISDVSTVRFDYYIVFGRPIISLDTDFEQYSKEYEYSDLDEYWDVEISDKLGMYLKKEEVPQIVAKIAETIDKKSNEARVDKDEIVANIGNSATIIAKQIMGALCKL
jgi:hypothetical protein